MASIVVVPYDPAWPAMFAAERERIAAAFADVVSDIEHVGSTAVPGLAAKPKIDILVGLDAWEDLGFAIGALSLLGYEHERQLLVPRHFTMKRGNPTTHRVHLVERRGIEHADMLRFRDVLRRDPDLRDRYGELKRNLASRFPDDHVAYNEGKGSLVRDALAPEGATSARTPDETFHGREHGDAVVQIGDTIRRPTGPWTPTVHAFLRHLHERGFDDCPTPLGIDDEGREVLSFLPGLVVQDPSWDGGATLWPADVRTDETLVAVASAIRRLHDASAGFVPPDDWAWRQWSHPLGPGDVVCHGDLGHWNTVHREDGSVGFIDWDSIRPDVPEMEFASAAWSFVPLADDDFLRATGWDEPPDIARRLRLFCDAYGIGGPDRIMELLHRSKERRPERFRWWPITPADSAALLRETAAELDWLAVSADRLRAALS